MDRQGTGDIRAKINPVHHWHKVDRHCPTCPCYDEKWEFDPMDSITAHPFCDTIDQEEFDTRQLMRAIR